MRRSAMQIGSLGGEIFSSLYVLYGKKDELDRARTLKLLSKYDEETHDLFLKVMFELHAVVRKTKPQVSEFLHSRSIS
jgi:hypothetical protein